MVDCFDHVLPLDPTIRLYHPPPTAHQAHYIKTRSTSTAKAVFALTSLNKWCLTGTPLQVPQPCHDVRVCAL
jgi:hypothetical protein